MWRIECDPPAPTSLPPVCVPGQLSRRKLGQRAKRGARAEADVHHGHGGGLGAAAGRGPGAVRPLCRPAAIPAAEQAGADRPHGAQPGD